MKTGPKEQQTRMLGPTGIARQYGGEPKAGYTERKPITVTELQQSVTPVTKRIKHSVTPDISVTRKRGAKAKGEAAMSQAERAKAYRARKAKVK